MSGSRRGVADSLGRVDLGVLFFFTAMAMLGVAAALVLSAPATGHRSQDVPHHVLVSPYQARPFSRGQLMVGSARARGRASTRDVALKYSQLGYAWLSITDVNTVDFPAQYATPGLVTLQGEEMEYAFGHFLVYGVDHDALAAKPADVSRWVGSAAGIFFLSRPLVPPTMAVADIGNLQGLAGIQLYDARLSRKQPQLADASALWDQLLSAGHHLGAVAGDDSLTTEGPDSTVGATSVDVQVAALNPTLVEDALKRGAYVDSTGVRVLGVATSGDTITVVTTNADSIAFIGKGGELLATINGPRGDYRVRWTEGYVRAVASGPGGTKAWTMPVWLVP